MIVGRIEQLMVEDHASIDASLRDACSQHGQGTTIDHIDADAYTRFRHDLLRHIGMEEKILLPYARRRRDGEPLAMAAALRDDHSEIAKLLVRSPTPAIIDSLREILGKHNAIEEGPRGLYAECDALLDSDPEEHAAQKLLERLRSAPRVPLAPYYDGPLHKRRALVEKEVGDG